MWQEQLLLDIDCLWHLQCSVPTLEDTIQRQLGKQQMQSVCESRTNVTVLPQIIRCTSIAAIISVMFDVNLGLTLKSY